MSGALSRRLQTVVALAGSCHVAADIGCDHAQVPIYLVEEGFCESAIAADLREGPLAIAAQNIEAAGLSGKVETRLSDGLSGLQVHEADCIILAGMGGQLISRILRKGAAIASACDALVLAPQSDAEAVRRTISGMDGSGLSFRIAQERFLLEDGKYYTVMRAVQAERAPRLSDEALRYGPCLLEKQDPLLFSWLRQREEQLVTIRSAAEQKTRGSAKTLRRIEEIKEELRLIAAAKRHYEV